MRALLLLVLLAGCAADPNPSAWPTFYGCVTASGPGCATPTVRVR